MSINKEELIIFIEVIDELLKKKDLDVHQEIALERMQCKFKGLLKAIETGGLEE